MSARKVTTLYTSNVAEHDANAGIAIESSVFKDSSLSVGSGNAAAPSFSFSSDADTGLYLATTNTVGIATNGTQKLLVAPTAITVAAAVGTTTILSTQPSIDTTSGSLVVSGGVAIQKKLRIAGSILVSGSQYSSAYQMGDGTTGEPSYTFSSDLDTGMYRPAAYQIGFQTGGVMRLRLSTTSLYFDPTVTTVTILATTQSVSTTSGAMYTLGGMGIGGNLTVTGTLSYGGTGTFTRLAAPLGGGFVLSVDQTSGLFMHTTDGIVLKRTGSSIMTLKPDRVFIGRNSTAGSYSVAIGEESMATGSHSVAVGYCAQSTGNYSVAAGNSCLYNTRDYTIRLGRNDSETASAWVTNIGYMNYLAADDTVTCCASFGGNLSLNLTHARDNTIFFGGNGTASYAWVNSTSWYAWSDEAIKQNIADVPAELGLDFVKSLKPIVFQWKDTERDQGKIHRGFSYQRIKAAAIDAGIPDPDSDFDATRRSSPDAEYGSVAPSALLPCIVKALCMLEQQINVRALQVYA